MDRRNFLAGVAALVGGLAIEEAIPLGRVWSFPSQIVIPSTRLWTPEDFQREALSVLRGSTKLGGYALRTHAQKSIGFYDEDEDGTPVFNDDELIIRMDAILSDKFAAVDMRALPGEIGMTAEAFRERMALPARTALENFVQAGQQQ